MAEPDLPSFTSSYTERFPELTVAWKAHDFPDARTVIVAEEHATRLGFDPAWLATDAGAAFLVGDSVPPGSNPVAMIYAGHQFGNYSPRLGDGRALLVGELATTDSDDLGGLVDLHLKGSGRTPLARGGDGFARLGPMLREYVLAHAMDALGIASTVSLAVVATGAQIQRDGPVPGAVLARLAASHIRVGTFEYAVRLGEPGLVDRLVAYSLARHYEGIHEDVEMPALRLLRCVVDAQASLIADWMLVGFIHGVMNTDNMAISAETIDYGPCAFLEAYSPGAVFSSIDHQGRYAYGNQPGIAQWDLTRFAETLIGSLGDDVDEAVALASSELDGFVTRYRAAMAAGMSAKLGVDDGVELSESLLGLMESASADFTQTFRSLGATLRGDEAGLAWLRDLDGGNEWLTRWRAAVAARQVPLDTVAASMDAVNPIYIARNHLVEEALDAAEAGDLAPFRALVDVLGDPYRERAGQERYAASAPQDFTDNYQTFCGT